EPALAPQSVPDMMLEAAEHEVARQQRVEVRTQLAALDAVAQRVQQELRVAAVQSMQLGAEVQALAARLAHDQSRERRIVDRDLQVTRDEVGEPVAGPGDRRHARLDVFDQPVVELGEHRVEEITLAAEVGVDRALDAASPRGNLADRRFVEGAFEEHLPRSGEYLRAPCRLAPPGRLHRHGRSPNPRLLSNVQYIAETGITWKGRRACRTSRRVGRLPPMLQRNLTGGGTAGKLMNTIH